MVKFGICSAAEDTPLQRLWRRGFISGSLLAVDDPPTPQQQQCLERLMHQICVSNGVNRATRRSRFTRIHEQLQEVLRRVFPRGTALAVEDWAVSNGVTSAEWFHVLRGDYPALQFTASDRLLYLIEAHLPERRETYILEPDGTPIQYVRPPFVVSLVQPQRWFYPINRRVQRRALERWRRELARRLRLPGGWEEDFTLSERVADSPFLLRRLPLSDPSVLALRGRQFHLRTHSVFQPLEQPVDIIRTMNILNGAYFTEEQLRAAVRAIGESLRPGGIWIVGRDLVFDESAHDVSVIQKSADGWDVLARIGAGSELEPLVTGLSEDRRKAPASARQ